jgi:hypothetical protein
VIVDPVVVRGVEHQVVERLARGEDVGESVGEQYVLAGAVVSSTLATTWPGCVCSKRRMYS